MKAQIVICKNDYPFEVLGEGATEEHAVRRCNELKDREDEKPNVAGTVYFHYHVVPVREVQ